MSFSASYIAIWVLVLFQGLLVLALLRQLAELRRLVEGGGLMRENPLPIGSPAPEFEGFDVRSGQLVGSHSLIGRGGVILFLSPGCAMCERLVGTLRKPAMDGLPPIIAFCQDGEQGCGDFVKQIGLEVHLLLDSAEETAARYYVSGFPTAVVIDETQKIRAYGHPEDIETLRQLVARGLAADSADSDAGEKPPMVLFGSGRSQ